MANTKAIIAAIDKVEVTNVHSTTEQHAGIKINEYFRPSGRNEVETVFVEASGRLGKIEFSVTKTEFVEYKHNAEGDVVGEFKTGSSHSVGGNKDVCLANALRLVEMSGYKL